jgi:hypothetical protein
MRHYPDWLSAFMDYASYSEAPRYMHFWCGVSAIAGALRAKVWVEQGYFKWYPNFYIILVAPPGVVSKSTTSGMAMKLLRKVPGINFGPDVVTWQALLDTFEEKTEAFEVNGILQPMSALTVASSEFGNLFDPTDKKMVDMFVSLWDCDAEAFEKKTKHSGNNTVQNPWLNLIACTTPSWIAGNFPEYMVGGGFTSRCIFVYADKKAKLVAYPGLHIPENFEEQKTKLIEDLAHISTKLCGKFTITKSAEAFGKEWYERHNEWFSNANGGDYFTVYMARKQTHMHKLAMILSASTSDNLVITEEHLQVAEQMLTDLEPDMNFVFSKIGKSDSALYAERLIWFVQQKGKVPYTEAYRYVHSYFPSMRDFEDILAGVLKAGYLKLEQSGAVIMLVAVDRSGAVGHG